jgi:hypothetical protein
MSLFRLGLVVRSEGGMWEVGSEEESMGYGGWAVYVTRGMAGGGRLIGELLRG